jgi:PKD repeat protein
VANQYKWAGVFTGTVQITDTAEAQLLATSLFAGSPSIVVATFPVNVTAAGTAVPAYTVAVTSNATGGATTAQVVNYTATVAYAGTYFANAKSATFSYTFQFGDGQIALFSGKTIGWATHKYAAAGTYPVVVTAQETASNALAKIQEVGRATQLIIPVLCPKSTPCDFTVSPASLTAGTPATFTSTVNGGTTPYLFSWNFGDGTALGTTNPVTHTYATAGTFNVKLTITDSSTPAPQTSVVTHSVVVQTSVAVPTVTVNNPTPNPANTGAAVTVTFTVSSTATVTGITVNWGDGTTPDSLLGTATSDMHTYASTGAVKSQVFTITVTATNSAGPGSGITMETVNDRPPTVTISTILPNPANTGTMVTVSFTATDPDGTVSSLSVNWGDGSTPTSLAGTATSTHTYTSTGSAKSQLFTITVTDTDNSGSTGSAQTTETVNDRPPVVAVTNPTPNPALTGQLVTVTFSAGDPDGTVSSISVNWGDTTTPDSLAGTAISDTHTYTSGGSFTITVTATDNSGSTTPGTTSEVVSAPTAPTVTITSITPNPANTGIMVTVTFTVTSTATVTGLTVNWGDGTINTLTASATSDTHIYTSTGATKSQIFTIIVTATNSAGPGLGSTTETVNDRPPVVSISSVIPSPVSNSVPVTVTFTATDPDGTVSSISVNWGDGTTPDTLVGTATSDTHTYNSAGCECHFTITITATDNSGSTGQATAPIIVNAIGLPSVTVNSPTPNPASTGQMVTVTFTVSSIVTVSGITVNWGDGSNLDTLPGTATSDTHIYASTGNMKSQTFMVTVTATNSAGPGSGTTTEVVNDRPPVVTISSITPPSPFVGQSVTVSFSATDPDGSANPISLITVNWGDGTAPDSLIGTATSDSHIYNVAGTFTITVTATDNSGSTGQATGSVTTAVLGAVPTVTVSSPTPSPATTKQTVTVTFTVSSTATVTGITVNWGDGTTPDSLSGTATSDTHAYASTGSVKSQIFTITVTATNSAGPGSGTTTETVNDQPPTVSISSISPNPVNTGVLVTVSFTATDPDGTISSISVNWGDTTTPDTLAGTATSDTHTYTSAGSFTITVTATDNSGSTGQGTGSITVNVVVGIPTVTVNSPTPNPANTGQMVTVTFTVTSTATVTGITVNWGDGTTTTLPLPGTAISDTHIYANTGTAKSQIFTITVTATNSAGPGSGSTTETVNDRPPTVAVTNVSPSPTTTGQLVTVTFSATDPDGTVTSISVDWGDGSTPSSLAGSATMATHTYTSTGSIMSKLFAITVTVTDNSGSTGSNTGSVTINDLPPTASFTFAPSSPTAGQTVTFDAFASADPDGTIVNYAWNFGDGTTGTGVSPTHAYTPVATTSFTVMLTVTDNSGSTAPTSHSVTVTVSQVTPPIVTISNVSPNPADTGQMVTLTFSVSSTATVTGITVDWGDGSTADSLPGTATSDTHIYASTGNLKSQIFTITVTATNSAGLGSGITQVTVNDLPPVVTIANVSPNPAKIGQMVTVTFTAPDSDGTVSSITVDWGDGSALDNLSGTATSDTHAYVSANSFTITVTATDNSGSNGSANVKETVTSVTVTPVMLTFQALAPQSPDKGAGQLQVFVNGQHVIDVTPGTTSFTGFGPIDITSFVTFGGQNTVTFTNPQTNQFVLVKNVTVTQGNTILLHVVKTRMVSAGGTINFTFSLPPLATTGIAVSNSSPLVGEDVTFTSTFTGGTAPFKCIFRFGDEESSSIIGASGTCSATHDFDDEGTFNVTVLIVGSSTSDRVPSSIGVAVGQTTEDDD